MRKRGRTDSNQSEVIKKLRQIPGVSVAVTSSLGDGFVDIIVGFNCRRRGKVNLMFELKDGAKMPSKRKLTPDEQKFHDQWRGQIDKVESFDDCLKLMEL